MFPQEKGNVLAAKETEMGGENFPNGGKAFLEPTGARGEFLRPGVRRGEEEKSARPNQSREDLLEKLFWILDPIDQIRGQHEIELSQRRQAQGVPRLKANALSEFSGGHPDLGGPAHPSLQFKAEPKGTPAGEDPGGPNEGFGEIDPDNLRNFLGELKGGTSHGGAKIEGPPSLNPAPAGFPEKQGNAGLGKIADRKGRGAPSGQNFFRL